MRQCTRDDLTNYRELCEARLKRLERYKKTRSFFSLDSEASTSDACPMESSSESRPSSADEVKNRVQFSASQRRTPYDLLREKMISLMETDMQLLQQLLHLGDTIKELREKQPLQRSSSETSLSSGDCEDEENEDELRPMVERQNKFSVSMSEITHLYIHDQEAEDDEPENQSNFQYFSRKNSVLRIPIPARASNRILGKKIPRRPSELLRPRPHRSLCAEPNNVPSPIKEDQSPEKPCQPLQVDDNQTSGQTSPTSSQHSPDNQSTLSSCCSNERKTTLSAASIDSGIRDDDENSSPVNDPKQV